MNRDRFMVIITMSFMVVALMVLAFTTQYNEMRRDQDEYMAKEKISFGSIDAEQTFLVDLLKPSEVEEKIPLGKRSGKTSTEKKAEGASTAEKADLDEDSAPDDGGETVSQSEAPGEDLFSKQTVVAQSLISAYASGDWDGGLLTGYEEIEPFLSEAARKIAVETDVQVASINNAGYVLLNNQGSWHADCRQLSGMPLAHSHEGTWVAPFGGGLERWLKGFKVEEYDLPGKNQFFENCYVFKNGSFVLQAGPDLYFVPGADRSPVKVAGDALHAYLNDDQVFYTTLGHQEKVITAVGAVMAGGDVKLAKPRPAEQHLELGDRQLFSLLQNAYFNGNWDGTNIRVSSLEDPWFTSAMKVRYEALYARVDWSGRIYINNQAMYNVFAPDAYRIDTMTEAEMRENSLGLWLIHDGFVTFNNLPTYIDSEPNQALDVVRQKLPLPEGTEQAFFIQTHVGQTWQNCVIGVYRDDSPTFDIYRSMGDEDWLLITEGAVDAYELYGHLIYLLEDGTAVQVDNLNDPDAYTFTARKLTSEAVGVLYGQNEAAAITGLDPDGHNGYSIVPLKK